MPRLVDGGSKDADLDLRGPNNDLADSPGATRRFSRAKHRRILMIHGCNTTEFHGQRVTAAMREALTERCAALEGQVLTVTWPGDVRWWRGGLAAYSAMETTSVAAGEKLSEYLKAEYEDGDGAGELVVVAHSLGCRVALEMVAALVKDGRPERLKTIVLVLMAAAVAVDMHSLIAGAKNDADKIVVLHSDRDAALKTWFPLAHTVARKGMFPEAVGLLGNPSTPAWSFERQMRGYDHEHYWPSAEIAELVAERLEAYFPDLIFRRASGRENRLETTALLPETPPLATHGLDETRDRLL